MNFQEANDYLENFISYEKLNLKNFNKSKFDLHKLCEVLDFLKIDHSKLNFIHVAGSKGKGTVSKIVAEYLYARGFKVGAFFSPHLLKITERIWVNGGSVSDQNFVSVFFSLKPFLEAFGKEKLSYFEVLFIVALKLFIEEKVDYAVLEVGLGGRLDATNIVLPKISVLTKVEKEHTEILGQNIEEILGEKLGIVKKGVPLIVGDQDERVKDLIRQKFPRKSDIYVVGDFEIPINLESFDRAKIANAKTAYRSLIRLLGKIDDRLFLRVFQDFEFLGRFDVREFEGKKIVFDVAHTICSIENLMVNLGANFSGKKFAFLFSLMKGKELAGILEILRSHASRIVFTESHSERSFDCELLLSEWKKVPGGKALAVKDCCRAFEAVLEGLGKEEILVVTGSNFLVGKIMERFCSK